MRTKAALDAAVVAYLKDYERCRGAMRWVIATDLVEPEGNVAASLRRLRKRGRVRYDKTKGAWVAI